MAKCISCDKERGVYFHNDGGMVCNDCVGLYFTCPDCGNLFDQNDKVYGDQGSGFCKECTPDH